MIKFEYVKKKRLRINENILPNGINNIKGQKSNTHITYETVNLNFQLMLNIESFLDNDL